MDSLTHIALGAVIGEIYAGEKLGKRAMLLGALSQSLPDIDFIASFWLPAADNVLAHRGFTHSFLFAIAATLILTMIADKWHQPGTLKKKQWALFFGIEIITHLLIDAFNTYGVGWLEPFSHYRVSFNVLFVADPLFSLWIGIAFIVLLISKSNVKVRKWWAYAGLTLSCLYLAYALFNKSMISQSVQRNLTSRHIQSTRFFTTPTAFNNWLWYVVVEDSNGYNIGYLSRFDRNDTINFKYYLRNNDLLQPIRKQHDLQKLLRFSQGYYTLERWDNSLVFNDLRFGQIMGWTDPNAKFVFHYYLQNPDKNILVVQRGRFSGWDETNIKAFLKRIKGN